jgi:hypothetical protein
MTMSFMNSFHSYHEGGMISMALVRGPYSGQRARCGVVSGSFPYHDDSATVVYFIGNHGATGKASGSAMKGLEAIPGTVEMFRELIRRV